MWRRKFRVALTILGIAVGIFAFTVMGSMALKLNKMVAGGKKYVTGQITILPKGAMMGTGGSTLPVDTLDKIARVEGVASVSPMASLPLEEADPDNPTGGFSMGPPPTIYGHEIDTAFRNRNWQELTLKEGRMISTGDVDKVTVGINIATKHDLAVGKIMKIRGSDFEVVGVLEKTMTGPDDYVFMDINRAREMLVESTPFLKSLREQSPDFKLADVSTMAGVSWEEGVDSEVVADRIKDRYKDDVAILSPQKMGEQIDQGAAVINAVILGSALLALIVGGFSTVNTMVMSVSERTKEIGIKKAIGASSASIASEYTLEAGVIGLSGGLIGIALGLLVTTLINHRMATQGAEIFSADPRFFAGVAIFSFLLGTVAGVLPAWRASRLKVVEALREL